LFSKNYTEVKIGKEMTFVKCFFYMTYNMSRNLYLGIFMMRESLQPIYDLG